LEVKLERIGREKTGKNKAGGKKGKVLSPHTCAHKEIARARVRVPELAETIQRHGASEGLIQCRLR